MDKYLEKFRDLYHLTMPLVTRIEVSLSRRPMRGDISRYFVRTGIIQQLSYTSTQVKFVAKDFVGRVSVLSRSCLGGPAKNQIIISNL